MMVAGAVKLMRILRLNRLTRYSTRRPPAGMQVMRVGVGLVSLRAFAAKETVLPQCTRSPAEPGGATERAAHPLRPSFSENKLITVWVPLFVLLAEFKMRGGRGV